MKKGHIGIAMILSLLVGSNSVLQAQWVSDNQPEGGSVSCFASNSSYLFAGTDRNGVFRSGDNGLTWTSVRNGMSNTSIDALLALGMNLYAATFGGGIYLSTDNGTDWKLL